MFNYNWEIDRSFHFEAGHRVWTQNLNNPELSLSTDCKCKNMHGHSYTVKLFVGSNNLDDSQMVTDFKNLGFFKQFIDTYLDHKFIIDINDPNFQIITSFSPNRLLLENFVNFTPLSQASVYPLEHYEPQFSEHMASFTLVDFVPTSENLCMHLKHYAQEQLGDIAKVTAVELWETAKSHCRYISE